MRSRLFYVLILSICVFDAAAPCVLLVHFQTAFLILSANFKSMSSPLTSSKLTAPSQYAQHSAPSQHPPSYPLSSSAAKTSSSTLSNSPISLPSYPQSPLALSALVLELLA